MKATMVPRLTSVFMLVVPWWSAGQAFWVDAAPGPE